MGVVNLPGRHRLTLPQLLAAPARPCLLQAFGFGIKDLFSSFESRPVASGSIGQIHRAVLSDTGARLTGVDEGALPRRAAGWSLMQGRWGWAVSASSEQ